MDPIRQDTAEQLCDLVISFAKSHKAMRDALAAAKADEMACHSIAVWAQIDAALAAST